MGITVKHILKHSSGRRSFRRAFPPELRPFVTGREFKVSLGTEGSAGFLARYEQAAAQYDAAVGAARRKLAGRHDTLDNPVIAYLAAALRVESLEGDDAARWDAEERNLFRAVSADLAARGNPASGGRWRGREGKRWAVKRQEAIDGSLPNLLALRAAGDLDGIVTEWREEALELSEAKGYLVDPEAPEFPRLCRALNDAAISALEAAQERLEGRAIQTPPEPSRPAPERPEEPAASQTAQVPILATFDAYAAAQGMTAGVRKEWREAIRGLTAFIGHDDATRLTTERLRDWRDQLLNEPTKRGKARSPRTVRGTYLAAARAMLAWALEEGLLPTNVAAGVTVRVPKAIKLRERDFTANEAKAVLSAALEPINSKLAPEHALARRWIPWLCAYTGARVNEFSQLRKEDVQEIDGIWTLNITPDAGTVKAKEARRVPIHSHLIEQGFLDTVEAHGPGPLFYDPTRQRGPREGNRHFKKVGERLAEWVRKDVGITDPSIQPNHAWRHTFKSMSYAAGMEERIADAIQGHAPRTTGRTYGKPSLKALAEAIERLPRFEVA